MAGISVPPAVVELVGDVADLMLNDIDHIVAEMDAAVVEIAPVMGADAAIAAEMSASNRANAVRLLTALARRDGTGAPADVPPEALDVVRTVVRRGIDLDVIFQAYRRGQNVAWQRFMVYAALVVAPGPELVELLEVTSQLMFSYVDQVIGRVIADAQHEREELLGGAMARRTETVRLILDGAPIDRRRASERLGYELDRRHTALVLWAEPRGEIQGVLESAATLLARAARARPPLTLPSGTATLWAWLGTNATPALDALRDAIRSADPTVRVAVGPTQPGITGFRRSHAAALVIQRLLSGHPAGERIAFHRDLEVTALAAQSQDHAAEFVATTLGPLAADTPGAARLRETLRVFLDEAENAPRAGIRLHTHRNTVLQRVARATELLGHHPGERRLAIGLALELTHHIGPRVLARP
ncbi:PucR family transcriptional regulator [Mycobacterium pseudokansasii]|uniref:PucR family transcriptional regulator n=1 Tax=Mycobacterium pseudokansasii TaxID=2341080 RepID=UPI0007B5114C|nr:helix-turn-helix domain-containing protein [Mycobacterium pseudokansasii]KZS61331.1 PucR family transcriptional regulator [Mycobacterium kansasii]